MPVNPVQLNNFFPLANEEVLYISRIHSSIGPILPGLLATQVLTVTCDHILLKVIRKSFSVLLQ